LNPTCMQHSSNKELFRTRWLSEAVLLATRQQLQPPASARGVEPNLHAAQQQERAVMIKEAT
jgi:hypothetical protein